MKSTKKSLLIYLKTIAKKMFSKLKWGLISQSSWET
jgi:hypothetical protein